MRASAAIIDPRFADDDLWDMWDDLQADGPAGLQVDRAYRKALKAEIEARERDALPVDGTAATAAFQGEP
jgi:hypothetical protein